MNLKGKLLPPSPRSKHARKPLFDINKLKQLETSSLDRIKHSKIASSPFKSNKKSIQNDCSQEQIQTEKNKDFNSLQGKMCNNHKERRATNYSLKAAKEYLCFECSLYEARKGKKVFPLKNKLSFQIKQIDRKRQLKQYIVANEQIQKQIRWNLAQITRSLNQFSKKFNTIIKNQEHRLQEQLIKVNEKFKNKFQLLKDYYEDKKQQIITYCKDLQRKCNTLSSNRLDVLQNIKDCISQFEIKQYKTIMSKYWSQIQQINRKIRSQQFIKQVIGDQFGAKLKQICFKFQEFQQQGRDKQINFTFSKSHQHRTPSTLKKNKGIQSISQKAINCINCFDESNKLIKI